MKPAAAAYRKLRQPSQFPWPAAFGKMISTPEARHYVNMNPDIKTAAEQLAAIL